MDERVEQTFDHGKSVRKTETQSHKANTPGFEVMLVGLPKAGSPAAASMIKFNAS
jgi:hypothetical protein